MILVKNKLLPSKIQGLGVFADEFIPKGTVIWKFTPGFDLKFTEEEYQKFSNEAKEYLDNYLWLSKKSKKHIFALDNGKYFNHSDNPNSLSDYYPDEEEVVTKAIRDIQKGEEITDNYNSFTDQSFLTEE